jgi:hypothetical protein
MKTPKQTNHLFKILFSPFPSFIVITGGTIIAEGGAKASGIGS